MDVPPLELKDLVKFPVAAKWKQLGVQLGVPTHTLDEIQANHENSPNFSQGVPERHVQLVAEQWS